MIHKIIICTMLFITSGGAVFASEKIQVGTIEREPFSYMEDGEWKGFSIDLWSEIAKKNNFEYEFKEYKDFGLMISDTQEKKNDISIANISITKEREKVLDFSRPIYDSGLNILELSKNVEILSFYTKYSKIFTRIIQMIGVILIVLTHYFFVINVMRNHITILSYPKEIFSIFFEVLVQIKETLGMKVLLPLAGLIAVFIVSFFSQKFTLLLNDIDEEKLAQSHAISFTDISGKQVGVTQGSVAEDFLTLKEIDNVGYSTLPDLYSALESGELDYIVFDDPILRYYAKNDPLYRVSGKTFNKDQYAMLFPQYEKRENAVFIKKVNISILELSENGKYDEIYDRYFN